MQLTVDDQVAEAEKVLTRWTARGIHRGDFFDIAPSGKRLEIAGMSMDRFSGGRVVESWA